MHMLYYHCIVLIIIGYECLICIATIKQTYMFNFPFMARCIQVDSVLEGG